MLHTFHSARAALDAGHSSAQALTATALDRIADPASEGARAFTQVYAERALCLAQASDSLRAAGLQRSPLEGLPISVKDLFDVAGTPTAAGSAVLRDAPPASADAGAVQRLLAAGAVLVGKTNMTEFAYSGLGINPHYGTPANPWQRQEQRIPGGSSSGAAVAVADGMCIASAGSDTGGSVRIPAALCGITGFKPTARRMPSTGLVPLSPTLDAVGVLAADVAGCAALDAVLSGSANQPRPARLAQARFAVPTTLVQDGMDAEVATAFQQALQRLAAAGAELVELAVPEFDELAGINASGGFSAAESWAWHAELVDRSGAGYDPRVLSRILRGRDFSARAYINLLAQRADWQRRLATRLDGFDGWLMPTVPRIAPRIAELVADEALYFAANGAMLRNPSIVNFMDGCAVSLPCHAPGSAPVGLSLAGPAMADAAVLAWAAAIEAALHIHP
ncbi:aspartyl-tRNA(Asn)/glutamyl-tRNA(Gln) amidotransferase subunit A [Rhodoferax ferrireducens]|uniref:Aspartyl-tRNA(Asn)/glutamyl-tRNA(Gln) amidotransferase subunit A n=1 Tax=Rhodoferax ferrireducens TaxID=192843 RepID=A0ABU2C585_9BURK|nr:amidase [Rhodoferax ferrireducens]MDR7376496.1 aspartyl-tRNA(Asn)/glutamyl-tRNA(Gln) amidotransferase subunit A [Rhodoferax ferrireducens]